MAFAPGFVSPFRRPFSGDVAPTGITQEWWLGPWPAFPLAAAIPAANCVAAYRMIATVGSVYSNYKPTSLAESYTNWANPGTYTLAPGVAPTWAAPTGQTFNGINQYLTTGIIATTTTTIIVSYSSAPAATQCLIGMLSGLVHRIIPNRVTNVVTYGNTNKAPGLVSGVLSLSGNIGYRDGAIDQNPCNIGFGISDTYYVGAQNQIGIGAVAFFGGNIKSIAVYDVVIDSNQHAALGTAVTGAMALL